MSRLPFQVIMSTIAIFASVTPENFVTDIRPRNTPAVLKGAISAWPAVNLGQPSDEALVDYLKKHDNGELAGVYLGAPEIRGNFFYGANTRSENFRHGPA